MHLWHVQTIRFRKEFPWWPPYRLGPMSPFSGWKVDGSRGQASPYLSRFPQSPICWHPSGLLFQLGNEVAAWRYFPPKTFRFLWKRRVCLWRSKCLYGLPSGYYRPFSMFPAVWRYPRAWPRNRPLLPWFPVRQGRCPHRPWKERPVSKHLPFLFPKARTTLRCRYWYRHWNSYPVKPHQYFHHAVWLLFYWE